MAYKERIITFFLVGKDSFYSARVNLRCPIECRGKDQGESMGTKCGLHAIAPKDVTVFDRTSTRLPTHAEMNQLKKGECYPPLPTRETGVVFYSGHGNRAY